MKFYFGHVMMILGLILGGVIIYEGLTTDYSTKIVDCFDRWDNKIIGETCLDEYEFGEEYFLFILGIFSIVSFFVMGLLMNQIEESMWRGI